MKSFFKKLKSIFRVFNAVKSLFNTLKSFVSLMQLPLAWWALILVAAVMIYSAATKYEALKGAIGGLRAAFSSSETQNLVPLGIKTSVTKDDPEWMRKYCFEQVALLPAAPFTYEKKIEEGIGVSIPPLYVSSRMPKDERGYRVDSLTCRFIYPYEDKGAYASMGVEYKFDITARNEFEKRVDEIYTGIMDPSWTKISPLTNDEGGRPFYSYEGFPLLFKRENPALGTIEYADMDFAIDYWVKFTVYEK